MHMRSAGHQGKVILVLEGKDMARTIETAIGRQEKSVAMPWRSMVSKKYTGYRTNSLISWVRRPNLLLVNVESDLRAGGTKGRCGPWLSRLDELLDVEGLAASPPRLQQSPDAHRALECSVGVLLIFTLSASVRFDVARSHSPARRKA